MPDARVRKDPPVLRDRPRNPEARLSPRESRGRRRRSDQRGGGCDGCDWAARQRATRRRAARAACTASSPSASKRWATAWRPASGMRQEKTTRPPGWPSIVNRLTPSTCILRASVAQSSSPGWSGAGDGEDGDGEGTGAGIGAGGARPSGDAGAGAGTSDASESIRAGRGLPAADRRAAARRRREDFRRGRRGRPGHVRHRGGARDGSGRDRGRRPRARSLAANPLRGRATTRAGAELRQVGQVARRDLRVAKATAARTPAAQRSRVRSGRDRRRRRPAGLRLPIGSRKAGDRPGHRQPRAAPHRRTAPWPAAASPRGSVPHRCVPLRSTEAISPPSLRPSEPRTCVWTQRRPGPLTKAPPRNAAATRTTTRTT